MKIIDRLYKEVEEKSFVCVGLDTRLDYIPENKRTSNICEDMFNFNKEIIDATKDLSAIFKVQIAYYEAYGVEGMKAYAKTVSYLKDQNILSIGDVKRGDISSTADMYAKAHFTSDFEVDFITVNPYMGFDSVSPYFDYLETGEKGIFVLLRTSNPGSKDIECLDYNGEPLFYHVGDNLSELSKQFISESSYSPLGFVVGGTHSSEAIEIRSRYKDTFFLIPGYGAQGAKAEDIRNYLNDYNGGIVNSSRGIITNFKKYDDGDRKIAEYSREAVIKMRKEIDLRWKDTK